MDNKNLKGKSHLLAIMILMHLIYSTVVSASEVIPGKSDGILFLPMPQKWRISSVTASDESSALPRRKADELEGKLFFFGANYFRYGNPMDLDASFISACFEKHGNNLIAYPRGANRVEAGIKLVFNSDSARGLNVRFPSSLTLQLEPDHRTEITTEQYSKQMTYMNDSFIKAHKLHIEDCSVESLVRAKKLADIARESLNNPKVLR